MGFYDPSKKKNKSIWNAIVLPYVVPITSYKVPVNHCGIIYRNGDRLYLASMDNAYPGDPDMPQEHGVHFEPLEKYIGGPKPRFDNVIFVKSKKNRGDNVWFNERFEKLKNAPLEYDHGAMGRRYFAVLTGIQIGPEYSGYTCSEWVNEFVTGDYCPNILPDHWVPTTCSPVPPNRP